MSKLRLPEGSNPAVAVSKVCDTVNLWQWSPLEVRLHQSINHATNNSSSSLTLSCIYIYLPHQTLNLQCNCKIAVLRRTIFSIKNITISQCYATTGIRNQARYIQVSGVQFRTCHFGVLATRACACDDVLLLETPEFWVKFRHHSKFPKVHDFWLPF